MPEPDLIELFARPLNQAAIRYLISGSVAAMLYGEPRLTHDIAFVVFLRAEDVPRLTAIFPAPQFYVPPGEKQRKQCRGSNAVHRRALPPHCR